MEFCKSLKGTSLNAITLVFAGVFFALVGFIVLASLAENIGSCWSGLLAVAGCWNPRQVSVPAFYFAVAGSALVTIGVWESGIGRSKLVAEGAGLVLGTGSAILALGFYVASLPAVSFIAGELGYFFGLGSGGLLIWGLAKLQTLGEHHQLQTSLRLNADSL